MNHRDIFVLDATGFPMIWIEDVGAYTQWLPVTKIQFEHFLCGTNQSEFSEEWYEHMRSLNPRISPTEIREGNLINVFMTGIRPTEIQAFIRWCEQQDPDYVYSIPKLDEWNTIYQIGRAQDTPLDLNSFAGLSVSKRAQTLLEQVNRHVLQRLQANMTQPNLAYQMLMRYGVKEWVSCPDQSSPWGGMGQPQSTADNPDRGIPQLVLKPDEFKNKLYGFRLLKREF